MAEQLKDFLANTTLNGAITNSALSLVVTSASNFPTSGTFDVRIDSELLSVTAVSGTTFTVTRAAGTPATTAASHSDGATVKLVLTKRALDQRIADLASGGGNNLLYADGSVPGGNTVANTASETAFASTYTVPANTLAAGDVIEVELAGTFGTTALAPTLRAKLKFGSTVLIDTAPLTLIGGLSSQEWVAEAKIIVNSIGATGVMECSAEVFFATAATASLNVLTNGGAVTVDTTADKALTVTVQWGGADPSNTITLRQMTIVRRKTGAGSNGRIINIHQTAWNAITGTLAFFWDTTAGEGLGVYTSSAANNDKMGISVYIPAGTYTLRLRIVKNSARGIIDVLLDGVSKGTVDEYAAAGAFADSSVSLGAIVQGNHTIELKANGKNASSSGYQIIVESVALEQTA